MDPIVSIIIPNYNHAPYLKQRIDSVLEQTYQDFEVIILDDKSTDNSHDIIESYRFHPKIVHIEYNDINSGSTFKQWQKGLELAKGEWIWIAESDDVAQPDFLQTCVKYIAEKNSIIFCRSKIIDEKGNDGTYLGQEYFPNPTFFNELKSLTIHPDRIAFLTKEMYNFNHIVNASSAIFRKSFAPDLKDIGGHFKLCGDWMFWIKLIEKGELIYIDKELNFFRAHSETVRSNSEFQLFAYFENAEITNYIFSKFGDAKLKKKYSDYLIYIYFTRYSKSIRTGSFRKFLGTIKIYGFGAIITAFKKRVFDA